MNKRNTYRDLDLYEIGDRCRDYTCIEDIQEAIAPMLKGGCPHYLIVSKDKQWFLLYAGVSRQMNLELIIEKLNLFRCYKAGALLLTDIGLSTKQVLRLAGVGYGLTLAQSDKDTSVFVLPRENVPPSGAAIKAGYTLTPSRWSLM